MRTTPGPWLVAALLVAGCSGARTTADRERPTSEGEAPATAATPAPPLAAGRPPPPAPAWALDGPRARIPALATRAAGGDEEAVAALRQLVADDPGGAAGDHAALVLGGVLVDHAEPGEALPLLRRAARGQVAPDYARLLLARAVVAGGADGAAEAHDLLLPVTESADTPALATAARRQLLLLATRSANWAEAARWGRDLLARGPAAGDLDETRWLTAEALRLSGEPEAARGLYRAIWLDTPGSPWGTRARDRLAELGEETAPAVDDRLDWIEKLQAAGLHRDALGALAPYLAARPAPGIDDGARARALFLAAKSHYVLRENDRVVERATALRRDAPASPYAARAAMEAIRAVGRGDRTADIRAWEEWLRTAHPGSEPAHEARYYLGTHLGSQPQHETAGVAVLDELAQGRGARAPDALWRLAWIAHRRGDDASATATLERLLERHPQTGYRSAALYWRARWAPAAERAAARELYSQVRRAYPRDYYGHLAGEQLLAMGEELQPLPPAGKLPAIDPLADPQRRPEAAYRRAVELHRLGLPALAADELATLDTTDDPALALARTVLVGRSGDTWSAIAELNSRYGDQLRPEPLGSPAVPPEVWRTLYPFPYRAAVQDAVQRRAPAELPFDPYLLAALARRESRFWPRAVSAAGAVGLMQLMPETAATTARAIGRPAPGREGLFDPATNLELGTTLLASHVREFGGAWPPAIASYNAGEHVVRGWWARRPAGQPLDEWIETIPYLETRLYVKAILGDQRNYRQLYGPSAAAVQRAAAHRGRR